MAQKILRATSYTADIECGSCGTIHLCIERDADGATLETTGCHQDDCTARLCEACPQFECSSCGLPHCTSHRVRIGAEEFCGVCVRAFVEDAVAEYQELVEDADLRVKYDPPPVPTSAFDWCAWIDGREESGSGYGPTRQAAIEQLMEVLS